MIIRLSIGLAVLFFMYIFTYLLVPKNGWAYNEEITYDYVATISSYSKMETCPNRDCIMADGQIAYAGAIACPRSIPFGTWIYIDGLGNFQCHDRLAKRYDHRIDIYMGDDQKAYQDAIQFGLQQRKVMIREL